MNWQLLFMLLIVCLQEIRYPSNFVHASPGAILKNGIPDINVAAELTTSTAYYMPRVKWNGIISPRK